MEQNRNIDFDSDVEFDSLKDAVWRLTTRVYLLEDFIAERFGEFIGPHGFTKASTASPTTDNMPPLQSQSFISVVEPIVRQNDDNDGRAGNHDIESYLPRQNNIFDFENRRRGRRRHAPTPRRRRNKMPRTHEQERFDPLASWTEASSSNSSVPQVLHQPSLSLSSSVASSSVNVNTEATEPNENDLEMKGNENEIFIPKDEILVEDFQMDDTNYNFLNEKSDDEEDGNDFEDKDPEFNPLTPNVTKQSRMRGTVGQSFSLIESSKGTELLVDSDKNTYGIQKQGKAGKKIWRCTRYHDLKCRGRCYTLGNMMYMVNPHCHAENIEEFKCREIKLKIKELAATTLDSSTDIIAAALEGQEESVKAKLPKMKTLFNLVHKTRSEKKDGDATHYYI